MVDRRLLSKTLLLMACTFLGACSSDPQNDTRTPGGTGSPGGIGTAGAAGTAGATGAGGVSGSVGGDGGSPSVTAHPNMFLNASEIAAIKEKVAAGKSPWNGAYDKLIAAAGSALSVKLQSVTFQGQLPSSGDDNDYYTEKPYVCGDGCTNDSVDRKDYSAAQVMSDAVRDLGLAYQLTGEARYADKAFALLNAWMVGPSTRMNVKLSNSQTFIESAITMPAAFYGADLIWNYPGWVRADRNGVVAWAREFGAANKATQWGNNFENWRQALLSAVGALTEDPALRTYAFDTWKAFISTSMNTEGKMVCELTRTNSLGYSTYAVNAMTQTAEIARHFGVDLYSYKLADGRGLELALDYHAPFIVNPSSWMYKQIHPYAGENSAIYELAYLWKQKPVYLSVIDRWGRPMNEERNMGPVTLTHAFGAYPH